MSLLDSPRQKGFWVNAKDQLPLTCWIWVMEAMCLRFSSKHTTALSNYGRRNNIRWCSIKQLMPDPHTIESILASKEIPTSGDDGMILLNVENWLDKSNFLRTTSCLPCSYALDIELWRNKSIPTIFLMFDTKSGPKPAKNQKWVPVYYHARYSSAVWCTILHTSLDGIQNH